MANLIVSAVAKWNGAALKKGQKDLTSFQKTTLALGKAFAAAFAVRRITQFGKASVQAFAADEKAAKSLAIALKNTGNGFATIATEGFIARLQDTYKVLDDELRPAFQSLLNATGSITKAQQGLELALNISAGTGKDLGAVSLALAKGFSGQTTALSRLGAGLDKATLASGDMDKITASLTAKFSGQALAATTTYTGQMNALTLATENAKEEIGKGLLDSIALLGGNNGINTATESMDRFGKSVANSTYGLAQMLKILKLPEIAGSLRDIFNNRPLPEFFKFKAPDAGKSAAYSPTSMYFTVETAERAKLVSTLKKSNATEKEKQKLTAAELADKKKQAELDALKKKFDVDRINLETALANSKDEAEKSRIRSLLTIMDEDVNGAAKRLAELDKSNADKMRQEYLASISLGNLAEAARLAAMGVAGLTIGGAPILGFQQRAISEQGIADPMLAEAVFIEAERAQREAEAALDRSNARTTYADSLTNITINTPLGSEEALTEAMQRALQKLNRYGDSTTFAGAL
jgi:hypothetical protein